MVGMQIDTSELRDAMRLYARATKKDEVAIVNRTARNFAIKVVMRTPKATPQKIESQLKGLPRETFVGIVLGKMKGGTKSGQRLLELFRSNIGQKGRDTSGRFISAGARQGSRQAMAVAMNKFIEQRKGTAGYIRRGWYNIARAFGAFSAVAADRSKGDRPVRNSKAKKATEAMSIAVAEFENMAKGAGNVAWDATQQALQATISDMRDYAYRVMQGTANKFSAKR